MNTLWKKVSVTKEGYSEMMTPSFMLREKLAEVIDNELASLEVCDDYSVNNWQLLQAEANGKRKAYQLILKLIKED
jgi:hypothetical protein